MTPQGTAPSKSAAVNKSSSMSPDAIALLKADRAEVKNCFKEYQKLMDTQAHAKPRPSVARQICLLLTVHAAIEEEVFYPASRRVKDESDLIGEADVEHASAEELMVQIQAMAPNDDHCAAKVRVLGEYIDHHVAEEQDEMFPKVKKAGFDIKVIGEQLEQRKAALLAEMTVGAAVD